MEFSAFAEGEVFGNPSVLYIITRGLALRRKVTRMTRKVIDSFMPPGSVWGCDFMLVDRSLHDPAEVRAITYSECLEMHRDAFMQIIEVHSESCPALKKHLRSYTMWLAFQRGLFKEARRRKKQGSHEVQALEVQSGSEQWHL